MHRVARSNSGKKILYALLFLYALSSFCARLHAAKTDTKPKKQAELSGEFFSESTVRVFQLEISDAALMQLRRAPRSYVTGTVREGNTVLTNVAIRLKGMGSFRSINEKPSLAVKFDEFTTNQTYRGLSKLMFNNSVQDSSYLAELLATQLFQDAGLPASRVTHARVQLNGRDLGLYVVIEAMNKDFLKRHFGSSKGNLYEAYLGDVDGRMEQDNGSDLSQKDLRALYDACMVTAPSERWKQLNKVLDVNRFVSFAAMEMLTTHWDGYAIHTNNYRIYHDPKSDKMVFITHGLDWAFRRPNISIQPPTKSLVGRAVLSTPQGQSLYQERIGLLFTNFFKVSVITNRLGQALAKIRGSGISASQLANIERRADVKRQQIETRAARVAEQLRGIDPVPMQFGPDGFAYPTAWRDEPDRGEALLDQVKVDGKNTLHIQARNERTRASWRAQVFLTRGWYRFEGMARTALTNTGSARLRISGDTRSVGISGSSGNWRPLAHDFEVQDASIDVEFVCELNALQGDVWFDVDSLRVKRIAGPEARPPNQRPIP